MNMSEIYIIVLSCDRYSDLWQPFFTVFWRNWSDCPFPVYLLSNYQSFNHPQVNSVQIGEDLSWSKGLKQMLEQVQTPYILLFLEDFFLLEAVDTERVLSYFDALRQLDGDMLRLKPDPGPNQQVEGFPSIGRISIDALFRVSTQTAIWRREFLLKLLQEQESAWEFEVKGTERSREIGNGFYCTWQPIFNYSHVIERGKWFRWAAKRFGDMEIGCDFTRRPVMTLSDSLKWNYMRINGQLKIRMLQLLSWEQRQQLRKLKARLFSSTQRKFMSQFGYVLFKRTGVNDWYAKETDSIVDNDEVSKLRIKRIKALFSISSFKQKIRPFIPSKLINFIKKIRDSK